jgi:chemotaxis protein methyltransferase CheR
LKKKQEEIQENQEIEIRLLIEALYLKYGYDFRNYSKAHIKRRILNRFQISELNSITEMTHKAIYDSDFVDKILMDLSITVTEMFRDPSFYKALRQSVLPVLRSYPHVKIWHAGCASGEEVYSMAIILREEGLFHKTQIYATDFNPLIRIKEFTVNYQKAGGKRSFSDYYKADDETAKLNENLKKNIVFANHNLVIDSVFAEMNLIVCRNVLIYFDRQLQDKVIGLFMESLAGGGFLCLGSKENLQFSPHFHTFEPVVEQERIYIKNYSS